LDRRRLWIAGRTTLLYGVIESPSEGWTSGETWLAFALGARLLTGFGRFGTPPSS
jgi:hypothetical protein